jgi:phage head maturation protease
MSTIEQTVMTVPVKWTATRSTTTSRKLVGTAAVFGQTADRLGFDKRIQRGAFADAIRDGDPFLVYAHDSTQILARKSAGTLRLREDAKGLQIEADVVATTVGIRARARPYRPSQAGAGMSDAEGCGAGTHPLA